MDSDSVESKQVYDAWHSMFKYLQDLYSRHFLSDMIFTPIALLILPGFLFYLSLSKTVAIGLTDKVLLGVGLILFFSYWWYLMKDFRRRRDVCKTMILKVEKHLSIRLYTMMAEVSKTIGRDIEDTFFPPILVLVTFVFNLCIYSSIIFDFWR